MNNWISTEDRLPDNFGRYIDRVVEIHPSWRGEVQRLLDLGVVDAGTDDVKDDLKMREDLVRVLVICERYCNLMIGRIVDAIYIDGAFYTITNAATNKMKHINIALDGPAGAGKSYLCHEIAKRYGLIHVDTGALYRTIGLYCFRNGLAKDDKEAVIAALDKIKLGLEFSEEGQYVTLDGENVNGFIRTPEVSMYASAVSAIPEVRAFLLDTQRNIAAEKSVIMDGRDIGTVILPGADVKIFLTASDEVRARRRYDELTAKGQDVTYESVFEDMIVRDRNDKTRKTAPALPAEDAVILDNSDLDREGTIAAAIKIINDKIGE